MNVEDAVNFVSEIKGLRNKPNKVVFLAHYKDKHLEFFRDFVSKQDQTYSINIYLEKSKSLYKKVLDALNPNSSHYLFIDGNIPKKKLSKFLNKINNEFVIRQQYPVFISWISKCYFVKASLFEQYRHFKNPMLEIMNYVKDNNNNSESEQREVS